MDNYIGKRLDGRYSVEELVGEGGMANVYKGTDLMDGRTVAIKILKEEFRDNEELVRRFKNEGRAISVLNQQNIVKVYDVSVSEKEQYIVMEHIDGITLKEYIEQRGEPLTYKESVLFISQVLRALQHAHDKGIVHRDIKPQNVMLTEDGTVKVMDFGIARLARSEIHTDGEQAIGSVHYISPEQAQGANTDPRADIYSAGIMMYEMLSGKLPFESDNAVSIAIKQISDEAVPLCEQNPSVPEGLGSITTKAMAKDPKYRYQTALEMLRDIEEFKRNPSVKFEYDYITSDDPARYIEKVANNKKTSGAAKNGNPKKGKGKKKHSILIPIVAGLTLAVVLTCTFLCYNIFAESGNPLFVDLEEIELPNFVGMNVEDVESMCKASPYSNLRLMEYEYEYNEELAAGTVIAQNPQSNDGKMLVKENQRVYLTVNAGVQDVQIPDVSGMSRGEATREILALGVRPYVVAQENSSVTPGTVFATEPAIGSYVTNTRDTVVTIYVSSRAGDYARTVPNLIGLTSVEDAQRLLAQNDLELGFVSEDYSDQPEGTVISQSPEPGTVKRSGYMVNITVSIGHEPEPEPVDEKVILPNWVGKSYSDAAAEAAALGVSINQSSVVYSDQPAGTILKMEPGSGTEVNKGSTVNVRVSLGAEPKTPDPSTTTPSQGGNEGGGDTTQGGGGDSTDGGGGDDGDGDDG